MARRTGGRATAGTAASTPALRSLTDAGVLFTEHAYQHDPAVDAFGPEAARELGVPAGQVFKTLVLDLTVGGGRGFGVAVLPVDRQLDLKAAGAGLGVKKVTLADQQAAERVTGYVVGGISPFGQRTLLPTVLDDSALAHRTVYVSGGRRGLDVEVDPRDLMRVLDARTAPLTRRPAGTP